MSTKQQLLELFKNQPGRFLSGEMLARQLGVSRAAVCKAVRSLKDQGFGIEAVTNKGYCLRELPDLLSEKRIASLLPGDFFKISLMDSVPSTNSLLKDLASRGAPEGTVILADSQTEGRGRMGRSFYSPRDTGLYLSLLLRPGDMTPEQCLRITTLAAAALCLTIEEVTGKKPLIKWVNDLFYGNKKICGILTEASFSMESGSVDYAVVGLGLNLYPPKEGFPQGLSQIAGSLLEAPEPEVKNRITAGFLQHFLDFYENKRFSQAAEIYRSRSLLTGKQVRVGDRTGRVLGIDDSCRLVVRFADGQEQALSYGEASIVNSSFNS